MLVRMCWAYMLMYVLAVSLWIWFQTVPRIRSLSLTLDLLHECDALERPLVNVCRACMWPTMRWPHSLCGV